MEINFQVLVQFVFSNLPCIIIGLITVGLYVATKPNRRIKKYLDKFDGPLSLPIVGSTLWLIRPNCELVPLLFSLYEKYKSTVKIWTGHQGYLILNEAREIEKILSSTNHIEKSTDYSLLHPWLGLGLLTAKVNCDIVLNAKESGWNEDVAFNISSNKWHRRRKLLTPAFHFKILEEFLAVFNEHGNIFVEVLKTNESHGKSFDIFPYITRCTLDIICETAMGKKVNAQCGKPFEYVEALSGFSDILVHKFLLPLLQINWVWTLTGKAKLERNYLKVLHNFTETVISARKKERKQEMWEQVKYKPIDTDTVVDELLPKRRKAFLDLLLDVAENEPTSLTDLDIRNEVDTFMFEGHDTTAANLAWTVFLLSLYPEHQIKIQQELDDIFGDDKTRDITSADISKMKYLELCIKESLRMYPSVPFYFRYLNQDCDLGNNRIVPKGTNVVISAICAHHDPKVYPEPGIFNPERFLPEKCAGRNPYAFIPFSAGPRNCIGQKFALLEDKIVLAKLFLSFNLQSVNKQREEVKMLPDIILRPMGGIHVNLTQRKKLTRATE